MQRLRRQGRPLVCVDLGSTPRMGLLPEPARFVRTLLRTLRAARCCGLLLTGGYAPLAGYPFHSKCSKLCFVLETSGPAVMVHRAVA